MAAGDLTTLANLKQYANITPATDDALLTRMISALSVFVQSWLNRTIAIASYTDTVDGNDGTRIQFANYPVTAVSGLSVNGNPITQATSPLTLGYVWTPTQIALQGYCFTRGYSNVIINYTAGFATTPLDLEQAVCEVIALRYFERGRIGQNSKSIAGETVSFNVKDMPASTLTVLQNYRRVAPLV